jgi:hypothetical protein
MNNFISITLSILFILGLFYLLNYLLKKNIENYGIYCGYYNMASNTNKQALCTADVNCAWYNQTNPNGKVISWCSQKNIYSS